MIMYCEDCYYWSKKHPERVEFEGICHRFPKERKKNSKYWCGEFVSKAYVKKLNHDYGAAIDRLVAFKGDK